MSNYMTFWKWQNYGHNEKISGYKRLRGGRDEQVEKDFGGNETILYNTMVDTCHTFVEKPQNVPHQE